VLGEGARLAQQLVNHGCFTVVNVGNDRDIANLFM
jgi:ribosomal protein S4